MNFNEGDDGRRFERRLIAKGKMMCSPYTTNQKFFLLTAFNKQRRSYTIRKGLGIEEARKGIEG